MKKIVLLIMLSFTSLFAEANNNETDNVTFSGRVFGLYNGTTKAEKIMGALVLFNDSSTNHSSSTMTDADGSFAIQVPRNKISKNSTITVCYIGLQDETHQAFDNCFSSTNTPTHLFILTETTSAD